MTEWLAVTYFTAALTITTAEWRTHLCRARDDRAMVAATIAPCLNTLPYCTVPRLQNDLLCVERDLKLYNHSLIQCTTNGWKSFQKCVFPDIRLERRQLLSAVLFTIPVQHNRLHNYKATANKWFSLYSSSMVSYLTHGVQYINLKVCDRWLVPKVWNVGGL